MTQTGQPSCKICRGPTRLFMSGLFDDRFGYPGEFDVYRCSSCGFAQTTPELSEEELGRIYTEYYPRRSISATDVRNSVWYRGTAKQKVKAYLMGTRINGHFHIRPGTRVLDVGCGTGVSLLEIERSGAEAYGTEYDENVRPIAQELGMRIHFGNLKTAPFPDGHFDAITMSQVLEHVADPAEFLRVAKRKLKAGGRILMSFPNIDSFSLGMTGRKWINWHIPYHINFFSKKSLKLLAEQAGLELVRAETVTPVLWTWFQLRMAPQKIEKGKPNPVWVAEAGKPALGKHLARGLNLASRAAIPALRAFDAAGKGDSFLVELRLN